MSDAILQAARTYWALGDAPVNLIAARENSVYRVDRPEGPAALRLHRRGYRTAAQISSELLWMDMLAQHGIPVPKPVAAIDGATIQVIDGVVVDMLSWVNGRPLSKIEVTEEIFYQLGSLLARTHQLADAWSVPVGFERPTWDLIGDQPSWGRFWENPLLTREQSAVFKDFRDKARVALADIRQPDTGLIHADLVPDNVLSDGSQLQLIDFDDGGFGYRLFDLATITCRSRLRHGSDALATATVEGYANHRQLNCGALPLFEALRACSYVGWNISRMQEPDGGTRNARFIAEAVRAIHSVE